MAIVHILEANDIVIDKDNGLLATKAEPYLINDLVRALKKGDKITFTVTIWESM